MGHGAPRELGGSQGPLPELPAELATKLTVALAQLDSVNSEFKSARDDERDLQLVKAWNSTCKRIDEYLRTAGKVLINSHQLSLDFGSEGGGKRTSPWVEESGLHIERLSIKLDGSAVVAVSSDNEIVRGKIEDVSYEWVLRAVVQWAVASVLRKG